MSIATQITRLQGVKSDIRTALTVKGVSGASEHDMDDFATDIYNIPGGGSPTQTKTATPSHVVQEIDPDLGYVLSKVTVYAIPKTETLNSAGGYTIEIG